MRKLLLILLGFIAIFTFINAFERPEAAELSSQPKEARIELLLEN